MDENALRAFVPMLIFFAVMYFVMVRPQQTQQRKRKEMLASIAEGSKIITIGGFYGTVEKVKDEELTVRIAENVRVKMARFAIQTILND